MRNYAGYMAVRILFPTRPYRDHTKDEALPTPPLKQDFNGYTMYTLYVWHRIGSDDLP